MKALNRISVIVFSLIVLVAVVISCTLAIAASPDIYKAVLVKTDTVECDGGELSVILRDFGGEGSTIAYLNHEQTEAVINHIPKFLFDSDKNDFSLTLENVVTNRGTLKSASVFGSEAVTHMESVRRLLKTLITVNAVLIVTAIAFIIYFVVRRREIKRLLFAYSGGTYLSLFSIFLLFFAFCEIEYLTTDRYYSIFDTVWKRLHSIFFMFNSSEVEDSFFNDALTALLNLDFFLAIIIYIAAVLLVLLAAMLTAFWVIRRRAN